MPKNYEKPIRVLELEKADHCAPIYATLSKSVPVEGQKYAFWYDNEGKYLGHTNEETAKKYVTGQLYYKTKTKTSKSPYSIRSTRVSRWRSPEDRVKHYKVHHKINHNCGYYTKIALYIDIRIAKPELLIDETDLNQTIDIAIKAVENFIPTHWNFINYPDQFKLLKDGDFAVKFEKEFQEMVTRQRQEVIEYLKTKRSINNGLKNLGLFRFKQENKLANSA